MNGTSPLGSRLAMPFARDTLANYLTVTIRDVVRAEVINRSDASGQVYKEPRIFDLLSSQPLCFNAFGELQQDLGLAFRVARDLMGDLEATVTAGRFEYSPGRGDAEFTGDHSAFDVFIEYQCCGHRKFLGIEVKYVENMAQKSARFRQRYVEVARAMGCFQEERLGELRARPLEQLGRDHLLVGSFAGPIDQCRACRIGQYVAAGQGAFQGDGGTNLFVLEDGRTSSPSVEICPFAATSAFP